MVQHQTQSTFLLESLDDLRPAPYNPRQITDEAAEGLSVSLEKFGDISGIVWNQRTGHLVCGHQRVDQLRKRWGISLRLEDGEITVPNGNRYPVRVVDWDEATERAANVSANNPLIAGDFDETLPAILEQLAQDDEELFDSLRFDDLRDSIEIPEIEEKQGQTDPDEVPEPPPEAVTKTGDIWIMDGHRLLCGDSTKPDDVIRLMNGERAVLFATDPPYLVDYDGTNHPPSYHGKEKVPKNKKQSQKDWSDTYGVHWDDSGQGPDLYRGFIKCAIDHAITENAPWYCWHASRRAAMVEAVWNEFGAFVHQQIIWYKNQPVLTRSWYLWIHEPCFFGWIKGKKPPRTTDDYPHTVWPMPSLSGEDRPEHPTPKPVECFGIPIRQHTKRGEICYEPFAGGGIADHFR